MKLINVIVSISSLSIELNASIKSLVLGHMHFFSWLENGPCKTIWIRNAFHHQCQYWLFLLIDSTHLTRGSPINTFNPTGGPISASTSEEGNWVLSDVFDKVIAETNISALECKRNDIVHIIIRVVETDCSLTWHIFGHGCAIKVSRLPDTFGLFFHFTMEWSWRSDNLSTSCFDVPINF